VDALVDADFRGMVRARDALFEAGIDVWFRQNRYPHARAITPADGGGIRAG
jgi:hypothetical protein